LNPGDIIDGRFVLESMLGRGGMGTVWRARQVPLGRTVALKLLREEYSSLPHLRRRFAREARAAARLNHEHICSVFDFGAEANGRMFLAMEYVQGRQLIEAVHIGMSTRQVVLLACQLLEALAHAHARGVVHRDLKPENVLMAGMALPEHAGEPKLVDFGIATLRDERQDVRETGQDQVVGTPLYMSPEQASGERHLSPRTDLYSLGLILYELLAGAHPFESEDAAKVMSDHVSRPIPGLQPRAGLSIPGDLEAVLMRALQKRPSARWDSAARMRAALEPLRVLVLKDDLYAHPPETRQSAIPDALHEASTEVVDMEAVAAAARSEHATVRSLPRYQEEGLALANSESEVDPSLRSLRATPFVGRAPECEELISVAETVARDGHGRIVILEGEAGVGKTRQMMWLKETLEERGLFRGHIGVFTRGMANGLLGLQEIFESIFRTRGMTREQLEERISSKLTDWEAEPVAEEVHALAEFLRPEVINFEAASDQSPAAGRLFSALIRMLELAATAQPRIILLDDIHWAGGALADWFEYLATELRYRNIPVLFVATTRPDELVAKPELDERWRMLSRHADGIFSSIRLGLMSSFDSRELVRGLLPVDDALADVVSQRSAGNPLYMVLLLRYLGHEGLLKMGEDGHWHAQDLDRVRGVVPPSLADLFKVRLQQIEQRHPSGERLRRVLARAAILGRRFLYDVLLMMCELEGDTEVADALDRDFDALLSVGVIVEVVGREEELYTFSHGLMRDVVLAEELGPAQRRKLHCYAARALEVVYGLDAASRASEIASHWYAGRKIVEAIEWTWRAAQTARRSWRQREALSQYEMCISLMERRLGEDWGEVGRNAVHDLERFDAAGVSRSRYLRSLVYVGDLHEGFGEFDAAERIYRQLVRLCGKPHSEMDVEVLVPLCQTWLGLGHVAWQRGDFEAARWAFERVRDVLDEGEVAPDISTLAMRGMARVAWYRGEYDEATRHASDAQQQAIARGDREGEAEALWLLGEIARMLAMRDRAQAFLSDSLRLYMEAHIPTGVARCLLSQAQLARYHKSFEQARDLYERALRQYESLGDRRGRGLCLNGLGEIARFEGDLDKARRFYVRALEILQAIGAQYDVAITCTNIGLLELRDGELEQAEEYLQMALTLVVEKDYPYLLAGIGYNLALIQTMRGKGEEANDILRPIWAMNERVPISDLDFAEPLEELGKLRAEEGDCLQARALWERALATYQELRLDEDIERLESLIATLPEVSEEESLEDE